VTELSEFDKGFFVGLLISEGTFGGDGRQPHVVVRMHTRHEALFHRLMALFPETRLYGPYHHGGRSYYQWMARGRSLVRDVLPVLESLPLDQLDEYADQRFHEMTTNYAQFIRRERSRIAEFEATSSENAE
jgi:hypothetical protein